MDAAAILFLMDPFQKSIRSLLCPLASLVAILENGRLWLGAKRKYI